MKKKEQNISSVPVIVISTVLLVIGLVLRFTMTGRELVGYVSIGTAALIWIFHIICVKKLNKIRNTLIILICIGVLSLGAIEIPIISSAKTDPNPKADYLIVLGAGVNGKKPSLSLVNRMNAALDYLNTYPEAKVITSGGQGPGEKITESEAMRIWFEEKGISPERIIKEDKSTSTKENLTFSFEKIKNDGGDPANGVAVVSSEYHLYRAKKMAEHLGAKPLGVAAKTTLPLMKVNYFIREGFAVTYMFVFGVK